MEEPVVRINALSEEEARRLLLECCGSREWARAMTALRPYHDRAGLFAAADHVWKELRPGDWLEAFAAHPRIGERAAAGWPAEEQSGARDATDDTRRRLQELNGVYEARFGHIFIVCATGRTAAEMLQLLESRIRNEQARELNIAADEQLKITRLRLEKLLNG